MKKLVILILIAVMALSLADARSLEITIDKNTLNANSELNIDYLIRLDDAETFSYQIGIQGDETIVLVNETATGETAPGSLKWNTENYPAGTYEAFVFIQPATYWPSRKFEILPEMSFEIEPDAFELFIYKDSLTHAFTINNTGNVPVFTALSIRGLKSESVLTPMTSEIAVNSSRSYLLSVEKPIEHYVSTLTLEASWEDESRILEFPVHVYNPIVLIEAEDIMLTKTEEAQIVTGTIYNRGNVYRNTTILFNLENETITEYAILQTDEEFSLEKEFGLEETIKSVQVKYIGSDGKEQAITENFKSGFSLPGFNLNSEFFKENGLYIALILGLLLAVLYAIFRKKKR